MNYDIVLTCAVTGAPGFTGKSSDLLLTPKETADAAVRAQLPMAAVSVALGGNVRVEFEKNSYLERGLFATNGQPATCASQIIERVDARVLLPQEAPTTLDLPGEQ